MGQDLQGGCHGICHGGSNLGTMCYRGEFMFGSWLNFWGKSNLVTITSHGSSFISSKNTPCTVGDYLLLALLTHFGVINANKHYRPQLYT